MRHLAIGSARPLIRCLLAFGLGLGFLAPPLAAFGADQATIDAAIEEGRLVYATNAFAPTTQEELHAEFRKAYDLPESFAIEGNIGNSSATVSRISQEVEANAVTVDWVSVNVATFWTGMREQGHILEYCSEEYEALEYIEEAAVIDGGCRFQTLTAIAFGVIWHHQYVEADLTISQERSVGHERVS